MLRRPVTLYWRLVFVAALLVVAACGSTTSQKLIVGNWKLLDSGETGPDGTFVPTRYATDCDCSPLLNLELRFNENGTVNRIGSGPSLTGTYRFVDHNHIQIDLPNEPGGTPKATVYEMIVVDDRLILRSSTDDQTIDQRFDRVP